MKQKTIHLARAAMTLLLVMLCSIGTWAAEDIETIKWNTNGYYEIDSEGDLEVLAHYVNGTSDQHSDNHPCDGLLFKLTQDITMTGEHLAIGTDKHQFKGMFDGCGYTITNLTITDGGYIRGLFGHVNCSSVKDQNNHYYPVYIKRVTLQNCNLNGTYVGGIAGKVSSNQGNNVKIENCHVRNANITASGEYQYIGGIVGQAYAADITDCTSTGTVTAGSKYCGGIIGYHSGGYGHITSCESSVTIKGQANSGGGIIGHWDGENNGGNLVTDCFFIGTIEAEITYYGAIAGYIRWNNFSNNYYASPCNVKGREGYDWSGEYEVSYALKLGEGITAITPTETPAHHSVLTGFDYFKASTVHLTLNHEDAPAGYHFAAYTCNGDIMIADGEGKYPVTLTNHDVTIAALYAKDDAVQMSATSVAAIPDVRWTGVAMEPAPVVTYNSTELTAGTDYLVAYTNNIDRGTATVTLTGIGNYTGTTSTTFNIVDFPLLDSEKSNSSTNPYKIETEEDIRALASIVNNNARLDGYYKQTKDIDLTKEHVAIGNNSRSFHGTYDGDNKNISGLVINKPGENYQGLFGVTYNATIKNVVIDNCDITALSYAAGIVGEGNGNTTVSYCTVSGAIKAPAGGESFCLAGIAGRMNNIDHCVNTASVTGNGTYSRCYGGVVGYAYGSISNCFNAGVVSGGTSYVGSIIGQSAATLTNNCHTTATTGGVGAQDVTTGTDQTGAEVAVKISAGTGVTLTLPAEPTYVWNTENLYKSGTEVTLDYAVPAGKFFDCYTVNNGEISKSGIKEGEHTLTGFSEDVVISGNIVDSQTDFTGVAEIADIANLTYNGQEQKALPVVTYNSETLVKDTHYTVSYSGDCQDAGQYTITVTGIGHFKGTAQNSFTINPYDISITDAITVAGFDTSYGKTGFAVHPTPAEVKCSALNNAKLVLDTDYELSYSDGCIQPGNYQVTINGKGNYTGSKTLDYTILNTYGLTVHNGLENNNTVPLHGYNVDYCQKCEFVMPAAELSVMNGMDIFRLSFYLQYKAYTSWGNARFRVFLKEVQSTTISSYSGTDGATVVYEGALDGTQDVMNIEFSTPYKYHGGNLLIGIYEYQKGSYNTARFYGETVNGSSISGYSSSLEDITPTQQNFLPKTTFWYGHLMTLADNATDNSTTIDSKNGETARVTLDGRTLYKDGDWNTICLPFDVTLADSPLAGATAKTLTSASLNGNTVSLTFGDAVDELEAGKPYLIKWTPDLTIKTTDDWETFADNVNNGTESYQGKIVKLDADIDITTMAGTSANPFKGTFDGNGHTLNVTITDESNQGTAPFRYISNATICNLKVAGTVTGNLHCAGLVGFAVGTNAIRQCEVAASVVCSGGSHSHCGGILGHGLSSTTAITDCLFSGTISGTTTATGVIYGWGDGGGTHTIVNCLATGTYTNCSGIDLLKKNGGTEVITNCYKTQEIGSQGTYTTATGNDLKALLGSGWQVSNDNVVPVIETPVITNPTFTDVTIDNTDRSISLAGGQVKFIGYYDAFNITAANDDIYYMTTGNTLKHTGIDRTLNACRAYFQFSESALKSREFVLDFGEGETTEISDALRLNDKGQMTNDKFFDLQGRRVAQPTKGLYINNGKKVIIK